MENEQWQPRWVEVDGVELFFVDPDVFCFALCQCCGSTILKELGGEVIWQCEHDGEDRQMTNERLRQGARIRFCNGFSTPIENWELDLSGKIGTVVSLRDSGIEVRLEAHCSGLDEWGNTLIWGWVDCFEPLGLDEASYSAGERTMLYVGWLSGHCAEIFDRDIEERIAALPSVGQILAVAKHHRDVDSAARAVQAALGVTDGGLAGDMLGMNWRKELAEYVHVQRMHVVEDLRAGRGLECEG